MGRRVKVQGDLFHGVVPEGAYYAGRAAPGLKASPYANPFTVKKHGRHKALWKWRNHLEVHPELVEQARRGIGDRDIACWCGPADACHVDILIDFMQET